jgi:GT2 family glycosyltransferase
MSIPISIVIPTFDRGELLLATVRMLLNLPEPADELLIVDQTPEPPGPVAEQLRTWEQDGTVRWIRLNRPSIPHAMNVGLQSARSPIVLFLDDDIIPDSRLVAAHRARHAGPDAHRVWAVVGQVLQPGEQPRARNGYQSTGGLLADLEFPFWSTESAQVANVMAGNLSVRREQALSVGGFDENFAGSAYRFETEFCRRLLAAGGRVHYEPAAGLRHLRAARGGTRIAGNHLASASPRHGMGDYYFALRSGLSLESAAYILRRPFREVRTRFHMARPWFIPVKLVGEARAFWAALSAWQRGPQLLTHGKPAMTDHQAASEDSN